MAALPGDARRDPAEDLPEGAAALPAGCCTLVMQGQGNGASLVFCPASPTLPESQSSLLADHL